MFNNKIFRNTQSYLDKILKKYDLSSGAYPYLFILEKNEGISQIKISKEIGNDKAMSARTINKLIESNFVYREQDEKAAPGIAPSAGNAVFPDCIRGSDRILAVQFL